jgi:hypothetical protein
MRRFILLLFLAIPFLTVAQRQPFFTSNADSSVFRLSAEGAAHLASLPLKCLQQEYPNKTSHTSLSDSDHLMTPKQQHPAFYGCFDWHSDVHGHWMLVRLLKEFPSLPQAQQIREAIANNLTPQHILGEINYFRGRLSRSYERTYGWAWLLKLQQELGSWDDPQGRQWKETLQPLCDTVIKLWIDFLPRQTYANRTGVHPNTAFGLVFALDYARATSNRMFEFLITNAARQLFLNDKNAPTMWEPDGTDFLSPSLEEADLMRRVLPPAQFLQWFNQWLSPEALTHLAQLPIVSDRNDFQIVHLDGLCFSRSWCMKGIAAQLPENDPRKKILLQSAVKHLNSSLPHIASGSYGGEHWLASFAVYALVNE